MSSGTAVATTLDRPACNACGESMTPLLESRDYNRGVSGGPFHYHRCTKCGLIALVNIPEDLGRYYVSGYHEIPPTQEDIERRVEHERYKIELVRQFVDSGNLLEIGPSWGAFCLLAKRHGFSVEAIERDPDCYEFLRSKVGVNAVLAKGDAISLDLTSKPDVIALWHVIEHLRDPWRLLKSAAERLAPGGILVVATPNPDASQFRLFGRYWGHLDAPRHVNLIPPALLRERMRLAGLNALVFTTIDPGSKECSVFGWRKSLSNLVTNSALKRGIYYLGRLAADLAQLVESREGMGAAYTAIFRKPRKAGLE